MDIKFIWTDGKSEEFKHFYKITEDYYSSLVGGKDKREGFIPYNLSATIENVLIAYCGDIAVGCCGLKAYNDSDIEIKRVWVEPGYRGRHIATQMMGLLEQKAAERGFKRLILQTREKMNGAVAMYKALGYRYIDNYPPYDKLEGAVCLAKEI
ncbi:MAG: GNAT family N-acetyltransferase [Ruminococcus sp.]|nr:GNAT family N-acetyltransferase [Ruminococcus sp.]